MPLEHGGGFALSVGSHKKIWHEDARDTIIGGLASLSKGREEKDDVYTSAKDMFSRRGGSGTCNLNRAAPELNAAIEAGKRVYDVKAGDVIFHTRWLFHRTVAFERDVVMDNRKLVRGELTERKRRSRRRQPGGNDDDNNDDDDDLAFLLEGDVRPLLYRRYSVRYAPGNAELPRGYVNSFASCSHDPYYGFCKHFCCLFVCGAQMYSESVNYLDGTHAHTDTPQIALTTIPTFN